MRDTSAMIKRKRTRGGRPPLASPFVRSSSKDDKDHVKHARNSFTKKKRVRLRTWWDKRPTSKSLADGFLLAAAILQIIVSTSRGTYSLIVGQNHVVHVMSTMDDRTRHSKYSAKPPALQIRQDGKVESIDLSRYSIPETSTIVSKAAPSNDMKDGDDQCVYMYDWQTTFYPLCNNMHEIGLFDDLQDGYVWLTDRGMIRDVWDFDDAWDGPTTRWALKTLRMDRPFNTYHYDAQVRDTVIAERASASPNVANMYSSCGFSSLYEFSNEGTLMDHIKHLDKPDRLRVAVQISRGLAEVHGLAEKVPFVHADIVDRQFVKLRGQYQLNDFNCGSMLKWDEKNQRPCKVKVSRFVNLNRSPEEMRDDWNWIDEKVDVYSMGNIYYQLLMNERKYKWIQDQQERVSSLIVGGDIPKLPDYLEESTDIVIVSLKHAMHMSLVLEPEKRATAQQVADYLEEQFVSFLGQEEQLQQNQKKKRQLRQADTER